MKFSSKEVMHKVASRSDALSPLSPEELLKLQRVLTSMLNDVQKACLSIGVEFVLCGGSCLGAIRHHGFIPWDDDLDIAIFRKDWSTFKNYFQEYLGDKYILEAPDYDNKDSQYPWGKIYLKDSEYIDVFGINYPYHKGINIDLFVIENVPDGKIAQLWEAFVSAFFKYVATSMLFYKYPNNLMKEMYSKTFRTRAYFTFRQLLGGTFSFISHKKWLHLYESFISKHSDESLLTTIPTGTHLYLGEMRKRSTWIPFSKGVFNGLEVNLPHDPDAYCRSMYGDNYMQLPPVQDRETHPIVRLKFPKKNEY